MIRWLWKLIVGETPPPVPPPCTRDCMWEKHAQGTLTRSRVGVEDMDYGELIVLRCKTCGDLKNHKVVP